MSDEPASTSRYGQCPCGGRYENRAVQVSMTVNDEQVVLDDVPQGACPQCGSRVYKLTVLDELEAVFRGQRVPSRREWPSVSSATSEPRAAR